MSELALAYKLTFGVDLPIASGESFSDEEIFEAIISGKPLIFGENEQDQASNLLGVEL